MKKVLFGVISAALLLQPINCFAAIDNFDNEETAEKKIYESGEYTYSFMVSRDENSDAKAACIESYSGNDTDLVIPEEIDGYPVVCLGDRAFFQNESLTTVTVPKTLLGVGRYSFYGCTGITDYMVADNSEYFTAEDGVLYGDEGTYLVVYPVGRNPESYTVDDKVIDIGYSAFACCTSLKEINLPDDLKLIGAWAFSGTSLTEVYIPDKVTELEDFLFSSCKSLEKVSLPATLTTIGPGAFSYCKSIDSFIIPVGCTTIGQAAFAGTSLKEIYVPSTVTSIDYSAFGWGVDSTHQLFSQSDFTVYGINGSEASYYVSDSDYENKCEFVPVSVDTMTEHIGIGRGGAGMEPTLEEKTTNENVESATVEVISNKKEQPKSVRIWFVVGSIGIIAVIIAIFGFKKKKPQGTDIPEESEMEEMPKAEEEEKEEVEIATADTDSESDQQETEEQE